LCARGLAVLGHLARDHLRVIKAFELAGACNYKQGAVVADRQVTDLDVIH
jgi:hypothetical protein